MLVCLQEGWGGLCSRVYARIKWALGPRDYSVEGIPWGSACPHPSQETVQPPPEQAGQAPGHRAELLPRLCAGIRPDWRWPLGVGLACKGTIQERCPRRANEVETMHKAKLPLPGWEGKVEVGLLFGRFDPQNWPSSSSVLGILRARILEWAAMLSARGSP